MKRVERAAVQGILIMTYLIITLFGLALSGLAVELLREVTS